jgi:hypothetical protein
MLELRSSRETAYLHSCHMASRRYPKKVKSFSYDLLADWAPYASQPTGDWIYHGTMTLEGVTGALAWRQGWFGIAVAGHAVRDLGLWERIQIGEEIRT